MAVRAITFDFWNTLFRDANGAARQHLRIAAFSKATGVTEERVAEALNSIWPEFARCHREEQRTLGPRDAVDMAARVLGVTLEPAVVDDLTTVFAEAILQYMPALIDDALEAVRAAAEYGPVALISDSSVSPGYCLRELMNRHGLTPWFAGMVFSDEVGVSKPQAAMFETAGQLVGTRPADFLHIGDLEHTDIAGAKALNAQAALFVEINDESEGARADYVIRTWREFVDGLPQMMAAGQ